jgi:hypothetical protein
MRSASHSPLKNFFDSGGLSYGALSSAFTTVMFPLKPSVRSVSTARKPANEPPITAMCATLQL